MVEITIGANSELSAGQQLASPAVYLDHWALRAVSEDAALSAPFTKALEVRGGTLLLSWANIAEFPDLDKQAARRAEQFIEAQLPRLFFLELNPFEVIQRENALLAGGPPVPPHADLDLLRLVIGLRPSGVQPITCMGMLTEVSGARSESKERMKAVFVKRVNNLREEYLEDNDFRALVDRTVRGHAALRGTAVVLREIVAGLMRDKSTPITPNDALDFFHTIVPVTYSDFALLDGRWRDQVDRLRTRLTRMGIKFPLATVFSGKGAIERLITALEAWS
jgi:hypothetical protein